MAKINKFYLNFVLFSSILIGFLISPFFNLSSFASVYWLILGLFLMYGSFRISKKACFATIFLAGIILSFWRFSIFQEQTNKISKIYNTEIEVIGKVLEDPDLNKDSKEVSLKIAIIKIKPFDRSSFDEYKGKIYVKSKSSKEIRRSDEVILRGKAKNGFGGFSASIYRAKILKVIPRSDFIRDIRDKFSKDISKFIKSPARELGLGFLLGQKNSVPVNLEKALQATALTHIVVASGYNLTILVNFSRKFFGRASKKIGFFSSVVLISMFVLMVGMSPSMTRAGIVALLGIFFGYFGRKINPYFLLILVASITLIIDPTNMFDLGWQLSFGSFFGVMIFSPLLKEFLFEDAKNLGSITNMFFETLSAQIVTLPLIIFTFGFFSNVSIFANIVVLPLIPITMLLIFLTGFFAQILPTIGEIFGLLSENILSLIIEAVKLFASQDFAQSEITIDYWQLIAMYLSLVVLVVFLQYKKQEKRSL